MTTASESSTTTHRLYLGIDVGGTGIKLGVVDDSGTALGHTQIDTEHERGAADGVSRILDAAKGIVDELNLSWDNIDAVGIGTPGTMDIRAGRLLHMPNMSGWAAINNNMTTFTAMAMFTVKRTARDYYPAANACAKSQHDNTTAVLPATSPKFAIRSRCAVVHKNNRLASLFF